MSTHRAIFSLRRECVYYRRIGFNRHGVFLFWPGDQAVALNNSSIAFTQNRFDYVKYLLSCLAKFL